MDADHFVRIASGFERQAQDALAAAQDSLQIAEAAEAKRAQMRDALSAAENRVAELTALLREAPSVIAEAIAAEAHVVDETHYQRRMALLDAARIARGVQL